jgi:hypothetical protein
VKPGREAALLEAGEAATLGECSVAEGEYLTASGMSDCSYGGCYFHSQSPAFVFPLYPIIRSPRKQNRLQARLRQSRVAFAAPALDPFRLLLISLAGFEYLHEENRVLREQLGGKTHSPIHLDPQAPPTSCAPAQRSRPDRRGHRCGLKPPPAGAPCLPTYRRSREPPPSPLIAARAWPKAMASP